VVANPTFHRRRFIWDLSLVRSFSHFRWAYSQAVGEDEADMNLANNRRYFPNSVAGAAAGGEEKD
jgi:hypothetical protein